MNKASVIATISLALLVGGTGCALFRGDPMRGRLLVEYPDQIENDAAAYHPDVGRAAVEGENFLNRKIDLEHASQRVADKIIALERSGRSCETARYLQIKAVYELRESYLDLAKRDLLRAEDALRDGCRPPVIAAAPIEKPAPIVKKRVMQRRHRVRRKKCICK